MRTLTVPRAVLGVIALVFLVAHLMRLAPSLEDLDSVNFALGVEQYDIARHQPHPPGYPIFIALGKLSSAVVARVAPAEQIAREHVARGLAVWGAIFGALCVFPLFRIFTALDRSTPLALAATALVVASPMFWFNASRPMSDIPGFALALVAQALFFVAYARQRDAATRADGQAISRDDLVASGTAIVAGAFIAGLGIGMRSQALWLTLPLLVLVLIDRAGRGAAGALLGSMMTFTLGVLTWALPMLIAAGGPRAYAAALGSQGREDFEDVQMLISHPSPALVARAVLRSLPVLWGPLEIGLAITAIAVLGGVIALVRERKPLLAMTCAYLPYALFHLAFQDTEHTRYAIPLIVPVVWLVVRAFRLAGERVAVVATAACVVLSLVLVSPALTAYAGAPSPSAQMLVDVQRAIGRGEATNRVLMTHHAFSVAWRNEPLTMDRLPVVRKNPWSMVVDYWGAGHTTPLWFIAEPGPNRLDRHHALALVDPASRRMRGDRRWSFEADPLLAGARPSIADWYELTPPGWFVTTGWALTPALAGMAERDRRGPALGGVSGKVRRREGAASILIGGRHFGQAGEPDARYALAIDGRTVASWMARPAGAFLERIALPAGSLAGAGVYADLTVTAAAADGSARPLRTAIEQFDLQDVDAVMWAFGAGWHESEFSLQRGRLWRWSADASTIMVASDRPQALEVTVRGESPLRYFDRAPTVRVMAGTRVLHTFSPAADFFERIAVPADIDWTEGVALLRVETDLTFVPDEREGNGDHRRLGLRVYDVTVTASGAIVR
ncbi:MAG: DUF2723 domain-containing protein [Acidobacteria bacterium]|nr:DUF2723 domain-containing protein [Acidobacteriota bacterium]